MTVWAAFRAGTTILILVWAASELGLSFLTHSKKGTVVRADRASMALIWLAFGPSIYLAVRLGVRPAGFIARGSLAISAAGMLVMIAGLGVRWISVLMLGRYFTSDVSIQPGHRIVEHGFYRAVRHPSYAGALLTLLGFGLTFSNFWSVLVLLALPTAAMLYRIGVEERALKEHFGVEYEEYIRRTKRLIPGIY